MSDRVSLGADGEAVEGGSVAVCRSFQNLALISTAVQFGIAWGRNCMGCTMLCCSSSLFWLWVHCTERCFSASLWSGWVCEPFRNALSLSWSVNVRGEAWYRNEQVQILHCSWLEQTEADLSNVCKRLPFDLLKWAGKNASENWKADRTENAYE